MKFARRKLIEQMLLTQGGCTVDSLAQKCGVSDMTIRRDLEALAGAGKVVRTHGGAVPRDRVLFEFEFLNRAKVHEAAKRQIASTASKLIPDGCTLMIDSGTTTLTLAAELQHRQGLTVITTSLPIAATLQHASGVKTILLGGVVQQTSPDLLGAITENNLESLRADLAFIGADAVDLKGTLYNKSPEVARMLSKMAAAAHAVYVVADHTKIGKTAMMRFGQAAQCQGLITDSGLSPATQATLRNAGINLLVANGH